MADIMVKEVPPGSGSHQIEFEYDYGVAESELLTNLDLIINKVREKLTAMGFKEKVIDLKKISVYEV